VALALSGGGDSVALLLAASAWAKCAGRRLLVLTVDHRLRPQSREWTRACAARAAALGVEFHARAWEGAKPATGLPAAARAARHRLLADAARLAGVRVILMGHTADDVLEAQAMRAQGATTPAPREWSPSPVWPQGRGLFLLRPMLALGRGEIREWLAQRDESWIEDPANDDLTYARARARRSLAGAPSSSAEAAVAPIDDLAARCGSDATGVLTIAREALRSAGPDRLARFAAMACLCAAGTDRPPPAIRARRLAARLEGDGPFAASLAGARIEADANEVRFLREAGEAARGGLAPVRLQPGLPAVWDGRFEIEADAGCEIRPVSGPASLNDADQRRLAPVAVTARPGLPAAVDADGGMRLLAPGALAGFAVRPLALDRLLAASGAVDAEPA
jgi:tRNA(Ile)-lysidine synthase